ncbi:MAG TPA: glutaredoxin family protein [Bacillus sp. (in: firmicutes)]|uniref:glutaredoxin family protein n=1 Tax=Bacillus litorisediminis TaxID=2922713 RepID=UPI001FABB3B3|nr:glutaredoxin family protein [Bacillus litorisediminis]HWO75613.1 glutaredoxin family protein [Bacillus sp. (in: firmicutes)]
MKTVQFYTRERCGLCRDAKTILELLQEEIPFNIEEIDIESDDYLVEEYGLKIPVIKIDGVEVQYGQIDYVSLRESLISEK